MTNVLSGIRADRRLSYRKLESIARHVRTYLNLPPNQAIDAHHLFENLDQIRIKTMAGQIIPLRERVDNLQDTEGYTRYDEQKKMMEIVASAETYAGLEMGLPRSAYFVAHELGHCVLHTDQLVRLARLPTTQQQAAFHRGRADHKTYEDTEWQANAFASALLMPAQGIRELEQEQQSINTPMIATQFRVSLEAARYRLDLYQERREELLR
jgi:Zn-dependent peptidase ImmA (M78 family)